MHLDIERQLLVSNKNIEPNYKQGKNKQQERCI